MPSPLDKFDTSALVSGAAGVGHPDIDKHRRSIKNAVERAFNLAEQIKGAATKDEIDILRRLLARFKGDTSQ